MNLKFAITVLLSVFSPLFAYADWQSLQNISVKGNELVIPDTFYYRQGEFTPQILMDIDDDGAEESILLIEEGDNWGIEFSKSMNSTSVVERIYVAKEDLDWRDYYNTYFNLDLHDFDDDGNPELIVTCFEEPGDWMLGYVFKLCGSGVDVSKGKAYELSGWIRNVGAFTAKDGYWSVKGNILEYKDTETGLHYSKMIYIDNRLHHISAE